MYPEEIAKRLTQIFAAYKQGYDVSPALKYRTEGFIEAGLMAGAIKKDELVDLLYRCYKQVFGEDASMVFEPGVVPAMMKRAPVKPST